MFVTFLEFNIGRQETISRNRKNYYNTTSIILVLCLYIIMGFAYFVFFASGVWYYYNIWTCQTITSHIIMLYQYKFFIFSDYRTIHYCTFGREYNELYGICHLRHWRLRITFDKLLYIFFFFVHAPRGEHNGVVFFLFYSYRIQAII